ncbi:putative cystine transporter YijE [Acaryochloris thomasi RCC1774]|uniref:Putative cystine transporter YijE n=1 Tax=Acaryochloris thomasi RCC1774 TaxID=1764569 RepID=A0A2W1JJY7_9CYAN|nr:putative cystine transporter YijE [Acaryochloris thomasi RCC1774]
MFAFAGNSILCRLALKETAIDAGTFTAIRILSGALVLWLISQWRGRKVRSAGSWRSAVALFIYATAFSFAYVELTAGTGALLLFGAVQATMIGYGLWKGERLSKRQICGFILAFGGLVGLVLPGVSAPPILSSSLMLGSGVAWGIYSLRGRGASDPIRVTAGNFLHAAPFAVALGIAMVPSASLAAIATGGLWAIASGTLASGVVYTLWYIALKNLKATSAATVQLSVPVIAAIGGIIFLGEDLTVRLFIASFAILGGIALAIREARTK